MCSRPPLPALTGASLCWGGLQRRWGRIYADELQPPQDPQGVFRGKLGRVHAVRNPGLLRTQGEALGKCGARIHPVRSPWHLRTHGELQEDVG